MTTEAARIQFAAEFVTFLVAAAGLALVVLRNELTTNRPPERLSLAIGFLATGVAAFGHGSLLLHDSTEGIVIGLRVAGIVGLGIGSIWWWRGGPIARRLLMVGLVLWMIAVVVEVVGAGRGSDGVLAVGSIVVAAALLVASRRSIAARVAASAAGTLLLVVLVLSVALSAVLSSSTEREELSRLQQRASTEAGLAANAYVNEVPTARFAGLLMTQLPEVTQRQLTTAEATSVFRIMLNLYPLGGLVYLVPPGKIVAAEGIDQVAATVLAGGPLVTQATCSNLNRGSAEVAGSQPLLAVAAYPVCLILDQQGEPSLVGVVLGVRPLNNDDYLSDRHKDDPNLSLGIVDQDKVLAKIGPLPSSGILRRVGGAVISSDAPQRLVAGGQYIAAAPIVKTDGGTVAALVVSTPTSVVFSTRDRLFRTLFLIALGGTLIALGLAMVVGDRITAGLRRLTLAAQSIQRGEVGKRSGITSDDEVGVLGGAFDSMAASIEEQTRALQAAADDETRLRSRLEAVVAGMGDALVAVDAAGAITDFNQAAEELTGVTSTDALGRPVDEVVRLVNEDGGSIGVRLRTPSPSRWGMLATAVEVGGLEFPVAVSAGALRGPGNELAGQVLVLRDLRREREVEQMKTEFLSRVGHELRTPLTGIMGYADILLRRKVPAERAQLWHEEILVAAKRLLRIVEMLEFFASSGAGRVLLRPEPLDVRQLIDGVVATWTGRLAAPNSIGRRVARRIPDVLGDRRWLALAIDELIDNAVKFSPGGAQVMVTAIGVTRGGGDAARPNGSAANEGAVSAVEISVSDRGKGMTPEEQATAFGEFVQGDSSDTRRFGGLGLGLSLVQRVVEGHGGTVRCSSTSGRGSTFTIVLPVVPADAGPPAAEAERRQSIRSAN